MHIFLKVPGSGLCLPQLLPKAQGFGPSVASTHPIMGEVTWHLRTSHLIQETAFCINPLKIPDKDSFEPEDPSGGHTADLLCG